MNKITAFFSSLRMGPWAIIAAALLAVLMIMLSHAQELPILIWKLGGVTLFGFVGYWLDRSLGRDYGRPHLYAPSSPRADPSAFAAAMQRRAIIVGAAMIAGALAL